MFPARESRATAFRLRDSGYSAVTLAFGPFPRATTACPAAAFHDFCIFNRLFSFTFSGVNIPSRAFSIRGWGFLLAGFMAGCATANSATNEKHWAYEPLHRQPIPDVRLSAWPRTSIDSFILARLEAQKLGPAVEADRRTLLRRVYYDLIGLPPTPADVKAFLADRSTNAYERVVDQLLGSPRYGERWARHWMDAAHFAETHGHDQDRIRTNAWPYRDYLIRSFNDDKPYTRFIEEQVAGDVLFPGEPDATIALGFLAAGPWDESSLRDIREDTIDRQIARYLDRDDMLTTVMQTFVSTTVQCARCHNHKFDPVPQREYYALQAVFAGVDRANRVYDADPAVHEHRQRLLKDRRRIERGDRTLVASAMTEVAAWEKMRMAHPVIWKTIEPQTFVSAGGATLKRQEEGSILASGAQPDKETYTISATSPLTRITAVRLEALADASLPHQGPGRQTNNGNFHLNEFQLLLFEPGVSASKEIALENPSADFNQSGWAIAQALDRNEKTAWGIHPREGETHEAVFPLKEALAIKPGATLVFILKQIHGDGHVIGKLRLSVTEARPAHAAAVSTAIKDILKIPETERTEEQRLLLVQYVVGNRITEELAALPAPSLIYAAASDFEPDGSLKPAGSPRMVHLLKRGDIHKPLEAAAPGALSCVSMLDAEFRLGENPEEGSRRAALARWLSDSKNPLTWRSIVNRVWQYHFGRGIVETPNDFGKMGAVPSHPELLDWLATWFRDDARGSLKQLQRLIVTSSAYRQASLSGGESKANLTDPDNHLLWRMARNRLDAEQVRDALLQMSDSLDLRMGGPSDMQFDLQPGPHVTPKVDYKKFNAESAAGHRRSIYRFLFRTLPDPFMDALDCPAGDQLAPIRAASVTVQQALAMWNGAFTIQHAEKFAGRLQMLATSANEQIQLACELTWNRPPTAAELRDFADYTEKHGLANFCRVLLNSNEFMFLN